MLGRRPPSGPPPCQVITLDHKRYEAALPLILESHQKSQLVKDRVKLKARPAAPAPATPGGGRVVARERLPTYYDAEEAEGGEGEDDDTRGGVNKDNRWADQAQEPAGAGNKRPLGGRLCQQVPEAPHGNMRKWMGTPA